MQYVLIQEPIRDQYSEQIHIIDNSSKLGKEKVVKLLKEGCKHVGYIESDLTKGRLKSGFESYKTRQNDKLRGKIMQIEEIIRIGE